jgi:hypothetical protein
MAKGQKRRSREPRKIKTEKQKVRGPKYLRTPELVQGQPGGPLKAGSKR